MNILVFDTDQIRLQQTLEVLKGFELTTIFAEQFPPSSRDFQQLVAKQHVVLFDEEADKAAVAELIRQHPNVFFMVGMVKKSIHAIRIWLQEVGVKECVRYPITRETIDEVLQRYGLVAPQRQERPQGHAVEPSQAESAEPAEAEDDLTPPPTEQEIVAITSARGGVGKSTIAYNLAVLAAEQGIKTVILDIDPRGNMVAISNTKFRYTADQWDKIDVENDGEKTVLNLLAAMDCGAYLLPSGKRVNGMTSETLEKVLHLMRRYFQLIILDCEPRFTPTTLLAYQEASSVLMVTPDDITAFGRIIEKVQQMREIEIDLKKIKLVINRVEKQFDKEAESILVERAMCKVIAKLPATSDISRLQKQSRAGVANRKSAFTKQMNLLLSKLILASQNKGKKKQAGGGLFGKLFKKSS